MKIIKYLNKSLKYFKIDNFSFRINRITKNVFFEIENHNIHTWYKKDLFSNDCYSLKHYIIDLDIALRNKPNNFSENFKNWINFMKNISSEEDLYLNMQLTGVI